MADEVITRTADVHAAAWKKLFDAYLKDQVARGEPGFALFEMETDYLAHVEGKPRCEGTHACLASRGIGLPLGEPDDGPADETACADWATVCSKSACVPMGRPRMAPPWP